MRFQKGKSSGRGCSRYVQLLVAAASSCFSAAVPLVVSNGTVAIPTFLVVNTDAATTCHTTVANTTSANNQSSWMNDCDDVFVAWEGRVSITATIRVPAGVSLTVVGDASATIDGGGSVQLFASNGTLQLENLKLTRGYAASGGGIYIQSGSATVSGSTFTSNVASSYGGGVYIQSGNVTVSNSSFTSNSANYAGGIFIQSGSLTVSNSAFTSNSASNDGGGFHIYNGNVAVNGGSSFTSNSANYGGGVYIQKGSVTVNGSSFTSNSASNDGGGVYIQSGTVTVKGGSSFTNNVVSGGGGGVYNGDGTFTVKGASFTSNNSSEGGGIFVQTGTTTVGNSSFTNHYIFPTGGGGGVFVNSAIIHVSGSSFVNNTIPEGNGGGIAVFSSGAVVTVSGSSFAGNSAPYGYGCGIYVQEGTVTVHRSSFTSNRASFVYGAGIYLNTGTLVVSGSHFRNNSAPDGQGGGIYMLGSGASTLDISSSYFADNAASYGGGVYVCFGTAFVNGSHFTNNSAFKGGGVFVQGSTATVNNAYVRNNAADNGGGLYVDSAVASLSLHSSHFTGNSAGYSGGAVLSAAAIVLTFEDCVFHGNTASSQGGAVQLQQSGVMEAARSRFSFNSALNGGAIVGNITTTHCVFYGNAAFDTGGAIYSTVQVRDHASSFSNNTAETAGGAIFMVAVNWSWPYASTSFAASGASCCYSASFDSNYTCADVDSQSSGDNACCGAGTGFEEAAYHGCTACPNGYDCTKGTTLPQVQSGYWIAEAFDSITAPTARACWYKQACLGGDPQRFDSLCADGYLEGSPYCAVCDSDYSRGVGYECVQCSKGSEAGVATALALLAVVVAAVAWYIASDLLDVGDTQDEIQSAQHPVVAAVTAARAGLARVPFSKLRAPIVVFQIVSQFVAIPGVRFPQVYERFLAFTSIFTFDLGWVLSLGCVVHLTFYQRLLLVTIAPLVVVGLLGCSFAVIRHRLRPRAAIGPRRTTSMTAAEKLERVYAKHALLVLVFTFLIYSTTSTVVFQTFACDSIPEVNQSWLRADYSVSCKIDRTRIACLVYAFVMALVYPLGIPAVYAWLLWRQRDALLKGHCELDRSTKTTRFLWQPYKPSRYWWEVAECVRRLCLTGVLVFIMPGTSGQVAVACVLSVLSMVAVAKLSPHGDSSDFSTYLLGCVIILITTFLAVVIKVDVANENAQSQKVLAALLIALNVLLVCAAAVQCYLVASAAVGTMRQSSADALRTTSTSGREQKAPES